MGMQNTVRTVHIVQGPRDQGVKADDRADGYSDAERTVRTTLRGTVRTKLLFCHNKDRCGRCGRKNPHLLGYFPRALPCGLRFLLSCLAAGSQRSGENRVLTGHVQHLLPHWGTLYRKLQARVPAGGDR
jgi:hypothetical protein